MPPRLSDYQQVNAGKIRTLYEVDSDHVLLVTSDTISAFDHILSPTIPDKGAVLTALTAYFVEKLGVPNHLVSARDDERIPAEVRGKALLVKKLSMIPVECVVRGYLTGSGLKEYNSVGKVCGISLPSGLVEASQLPEPIFTPAIKAQVGDHDENVDFETIVRLHGTEIAHRLRELSLDIYRRGAQLALERGIILADTKFEFGIDQNGDIILADEVLTPDSSRYWPKDNYEPGMIQPSFDKQIVRNWLQYDSGWDVASDSAPPSLPENIVQLTRDKYVEAYERITGLQFSEWTQN